MQKNLRKSLKKYLNDKTIFDIILYGSVAKGSLEPNDLDLVIIFNEGSLENRLNKLQIIKNELKNKLSKEFKKLDLKQIVLEELFKESFFARTGILLEGISLKNVVPFSENLGFKGMCLYWYDLENLSHNEKVKFNYILAGRNNNKGILDLFNIQRLANGALLVPISKSYEFELILKNNKINYSKKNILVE
ncbi:MAG: nucleotidyltransferase domain-containing protein [Candidatus Woesearchaeota archaeon]